MGGGARAALLAPTRELALQTYKVVTELGKHTDLRTAVLVGGDSIQAQFAELAASPDALVATPGRLLHLLTEVPGFNLKGVAHVVLDEADRLFEMGLGEQVCVLHLLALLLVFEIAFCCACVRVGELADGPRVGDVQLAELGNDGVGHATFWSIASNLRSLGEGCGEGFTQ
jgi:DEAD/DEAH box helicase